MQRTRRPAVNLPVRGACEHCLRKKKFGGDGTSRQPCVRRRCIVIHGDPSDWQGQQHSGATKATPPGVPQVSQPKEPPTSSSRVQRPPVADGPGRHGDPESSSDTNGKAAAVNSSRKKLPKRRFPEVSNLETSLIPIPQEEKTIEPQTKKADVKKYYRRIFGRKLPPAPLIGVCAACGDDSKPETVLLCDGKDCEREYHIGCANLKEVPSGDWFCVDCHPTGSGIEVLARYLELVDDARNDYEHSKSFVQAMLQRQLEETNLRAPISELDKGQGSTDLLFPKRFLGKPIWIRVPEMEAQVPGRIVDYRSCKTSEPDHTEYVFLVRFAAGHYDRKDSLYHWIYLEEHQLIIGDRLVLARKGIESRQQPGLIYLRTSLELLLADETNRDLMIKQRELSDFPVSPPGIATSTKLSSTSPKPCNVEKQLKECHEEAGNIKRTVLVGFFGQVGAKKFVCLDLDTDKVSVAQDEEGKKLLIDFFSPGALEAKELRLPEVALAFVEHEEQKNVVSWQSIPHGNPSHPSSLKSRDYFSLTPMVPQEGDGCVAPFGSTENSLVAATGELHAQLCPLIMAGIDQQHVMNILHKNHPEIQPSKEFAANLSCTIVPYKWPGGPREDLLPKACAKNEERKDSETVPSTNMDG
ncbi:hypothetical protein ACA910_018231 [Epithemia clementina (nom. ined.)]